MLRFVWAAAILVAGLPALPAAEPCADPRLPASARAGHDISCTVAVHVAHGDPHAATEGIGVRREAVLQLARDGLVDLYGRLTASVRADGEDVHGGCRWPTWIDDDAIGDTVRIAMPAVDQMQRHKIAVDDRARCAIEVKAIESTRNGSCLK